MMGETGFKLKQAIIDGTIPTAQMQIPKLHPGGKMPGSINQQFQRRQIPEFRQNAPQVVLHDFSANHKQSTGNYFTFIFS